jgi:hypothetical protein
MESLLPAAFVLEEDCNAFYCCENDTADQNISDLAGMLTALGLREPAKPLPGDSCFTDDFECLSFCNEIKLCLQWKNRIYYLGEPSLKLCLILSIMQFQSLLKALSAKTTRSTPRRL